MGIKFDNFMVNSYIYMTGFWKIYYTHMQGALQIIIIMTLVKQPDIPVRDMLN